MQTIIHTRNGYVITELIDDGVLLRDAQDFLDLVANCPSRNIILHKENRNCLKTCFNKGRN